MALSGLVLVGFVVGHLVGNLQVFQGPDHLNGYAAFLHNLGPLLWLARIGVVVAVLVHVWAATVLTIENKVARGPEQYGIRHTIRATLSSRTMRMTGYVVFAFLLYHLAHFTLGVGGNLTEVGSFKGNIPQYALQSDYRVAGLVAVPASVGNVDDVYNMVVLGFQNPIVSIFYVIAVGLLSMHLLHGFDSAFQTLGLRSGRWASGLRVVTVLFCTVYFLGNLAIPGAVLIGKLQPRTAAVATAPSHH
jgi:succinate dehydrogenase / fumarate reductase cytochrome b subunit